MGINPFDTLNAGMLGATAAIKQQQQIQSLMNQQNAMMAQAQGVANPQFQNAYSNSGKLYGMFSVEWDYEKRAYRLKYGKSYVLIPESATYEECERALGGAKIVEETRLKREADEAEFAKFKDRQDAAMKSVADKWDDQILKHVMEQTNVSNDVIPDVSLSRVFKWAVVLVIAMALGERVWKMFGPKISAQINKAIGTVESA